MDQPILTKRPRKYTWLTDRVWSAGIPVCTDTGWISYAGFPRLAAASPAIPPLVLSPSRCMASVKCHENKLLSVRFMSTEFRLIGVERWHGVKLPNNQTVNLVRRNPQLKSAMSSAYIRFYR